MCIAPPRYRLKLKPGLQSWGLSAERGLRTGVKAGQSFLFPGGVQPV